MLQKPDLPDSELVDCLQREFGLPAQQVEFLPIGADTNTAVYRATTSNSATYFVKLRSGEFDELTILVPHYLETQGIPHLIAPIETQNGQLWTRLEQFAVILYPFIDGQDGFSSHLTDQQWIELGEILRGVHSVELPAEIRQRLSRESFPTIWFERTRAYQRLFETESFSDPISVQLGELMRAQREVITTLIERAEAHEQAFRTHSPVFVLCHADIHGGNVLMEPNGDLYVVDWDTLMLAPKERDLMFIGGGIGNDWNRERDVDLFYQGYGPAEIDPDGIAYYRCIRILEDIALYCEQILESEPDNPDRAQALVYISSNFLPNETIEIAFRSGPAGRSS